VRSVEAKISLGVNSKEWPVSQLPLNLAPSESFISAANGRVRSPGISKIGKKQPGPIAAGESPACAANFSTGIVPRHQSMPYASSESGGEWRKPLRMEASWYHNLIPSANCDGPERGNVHA
jgi:hypothetical protein